MVPGVGAARRKGQGCRREDRDYAGGNLADAGRVLKSLVGDLAVVVVLFDKRRCTREYGGRTDALVDDFSTQCVRVVNLEIDVRGAERHRRQRDRSSVEVPAGWFHDQDASGDSGTTTNSP